MSPSRRYRHPRPVPAVPPMLMLLCLLVASVVWPATAGAQGRDSTFARSWLDPDLPAADRVDSLIARLDTGEKIGLMLADSPGVPRLDIPPYHWWNEALHGVARNGRATIFPQAINMGATFDPELVRRVGEAVSLEARAKFNLARAQENRGQYAGLTFWSPVVNLYRDLRWGRGQETYGEDPFLAGLLGSAYVLGLQGDHPRYLRAAAAAKHFAAHSGPEQGRSSFNARVTRRDLAASYLPPFERLVRQAGVEGVMCAYNGINGVPACADPSLISDTLRGAWDFNGYVVSDCGAIGNIHSYQGYAGSQEEAAAMALQAGVNVNCGGNWRSSLREAVERGRVRVEELDRSLRQSLPTLFRLGLFDPPSMDPWRDLGEQELASESHHELARRTAEQSMVLLKNEGVLPLSSNLSGLAVMGPGATSAEVLLGNYHGSSGRLSTFLEGISGAVGGGTKIIYYPGIDFDRGSLAESGWGISQAKTTGAIVACIGLSPGMEGEGKEAVYGTEEPVVELPPHQVEWIRALRENYGGKLIVVVTGGSPRAIPEIHDMADAVIWAGYPGQAGGEALARLLFGEVSPSAKLPVTVPYRTEDLPPFEDYSMEGRTYRYAGKEPLYPFGFGLSYTRFEYDSLRVSTQTLRPGDTLQVSVALRNAGERAGGEVVQLYVEDPNASPGESRYRLADLQRVGLDPGERRTVQFTLPASEFQTVDAAGMRRFVQGRWVLHAGGSSPLPRAIALGADPPVMARIELKR